MENKSSVAKMTEMKTAEEINILFEHKPIDFLDHLNHTCEQKCTCAHVCTCSHMHVHMDKSIYICAKTGKNSYMYAYGHICCGYVNKCT